MSFEESTYLPALLVYSTMKSKEIWEGWVQFSALFHKTSGRTAGHALRYWSFSLRSYVALMFTISWYTDESNDQFTDDVGYARFPLS